MDDLINRLEKATGPDRHLDADVMRAAFDAEVWSYDDNDHIDAQMKNGLWKGKKEDHPDYDSEPRVTWRYRRGGKPGTDPAAEYGELLPYTASIDAALTLLPPQAGWNVQGNSITFYAMVAGHGDKPAVNPAIALCIAALKARRAADTRA